MRRVILLLVTTCLLISTKVVYPWSYYSHVGMTRAAARYVFNLDTTSTAPKIGEFTVIIKYEMHIDFAKTVGKNLGFFGGLLESFIGSIVDMKLSEDKFKVNETMTYPPPKKKYLNTLDKIIAEAGSHPDDFDKKTGLIGEGDMLLGHIYAPNGIGFADYMVEFFYNKADTAYQKGKKNEAFVYLAYASHYLVDAGIPVHAEADYRNINVLQWQLKYHSYTEKYVSENWKKYQATADSAAKVPMPVCDIRAMVRSLAMETYPDIAEWNHAWGSKGGGEYKTGDQPANQKRFDELVRQEIWRCVPRVSGLFMKFKQEVMKGGN